MVRGLYIAGTGMMLQRRKMETITNNITNADTSGYKKDELVSHTFDDVMLRRLNDEDPYILARTPAILRDLPQVGPLTFGAQVDQLYTSFTQGNIETTDRTTDLCIVGDAFFVIETTDGERYTRTGAFYLTQDGYLIDGEGNFLLGEVGRVYVGSEDFSVNETGQVEVDGEIVNTLRLVTFENPGDLRKQGSNLYYSLTPAVEEAAESVVKQGFLESSNVEIAREMVDMITVYRAYETNQRMVQMIDETVGKAVNEIGRLR